TDQFLDVYQDVRREGRLLGTIYIRSDLKELQLRLRRFALMVAILLPGSLVVAYVMTSRFQRVISMPIRELVRLEGIVSQERDYGIRASKQANDEVGALMDGFNEMLGQIQIRDDELRI